MANPLLERMSPAELAERAQVIEFKGCIGDFERLVGIVEADFAALEAEFRPRDWRLAPVTGRLEFAWQDMRKEFPAATGRLNAEMPAICQRCLEPFRMPLDVSLRTIFVSADAAMTDLPEVEVWELQEEVLRLQDLVEESIVMALPLAPLHDTAGQCGPLAM